MRNSGNGGASVVRREMRVRGVSLLVNYGKGFSALAERRFTNVDPRIPDINWRKIVKDQPKVRIHGFLTNFRMDRQVDECLEMFNRRGWRSADIFALLALAAEDPKAGVDFRVLLLDSYTVKGGSVCPMMYKNALGRRDLGLRPSSREVYDDMWVLAVPNGSC